MKQTQNAEIKIIISHHGQIIAMCTTEFAMLPIPNSEMSSEAINRMHLKNIYIQLMYLLTILEMSLWHLAQRLSLSTQV